MSATESQYIDIYEKYREVIFSNGASLLNDCRENAYKWFKTNGLPTSRDELYRHSKIKDLFDFDYGLNLNRLKFPTPDNLFHCDVPINSYLCFLVDEYFMFSDASRLCWDELMSKGVLIGSLREAAENHPELVATYYHQSKGIDKDSLVAFNTMFTQDGFFLYVPDGVVIENPIQLICVSNASVPAISNPRNLIVLGNNAKASLLMCEHTMSDRESLANFVTEVFVGDNSYFDYYKLESSGNKSVSLDSFFLSQGKDSNVLINDMTLQNGFSRNNLKIDLNGMGAELALCGMVIGDAEQHVDNYTVVNHNVPNCTSKELFKYVLNDASVGAFSGRVYVAKDAQKTAAYQTNKNICVGKEAKMFTEPQLEIYADDVKCSHGASTGQMDETALFYLRSRGIPEAEAKMLLMFAFVSDVIENIRIDSLQDKIRLMVEKRFRGELPQCKGCNVRCGS
jgi:Fe-S cluster assembly protein SufD